MGKETARNRERERIKGKKYVINRERTTNTKGLIKKTVTHGSCRNKETWKRAVHFSQTACIE